MEEVIKLYIFPKMRARIALISLPPHFLSRMKICSLPAGGGGGFHATAAMPEVISSSQHLTTFSGGCCMRFSRTYTLFVAMRLSVFQVENRPGSRRPVSFVTSQLDRSIIPLTGKGLCGFLIFFFRSLLCMCVPRS